MIALTLAGRDGWKIRQSWKDERSMSRTPAPKPPEDTSEQARRALQTSMDTRQ